MLTEITSNLEAYSVYIDVVIHLEMAGSKKKVVEGIREKVTCEHFTNKEIVIFVYICF